MFKLEMETDGAAFCDEKSGEKDKVSENFEVARIMVDVMHQLRHGRRRGICVDDNGNKVGTWRVG